MVFDPARGRTVLCAGTTWTWDGIDWTQSLPPTNPSGVSSSAFAFDSLRQRGVFYGGQGVAGELSPSTWEWDGSTWTNVSGGPAARRFAAMAYADRRGSALLFGGQSLDAHVDAFGDAWEWDGSSWSERATATRPAPRAGAAIAYDSQRDRYVLFGGVANSGSINPLIRFGATWELDRANWILASVTSSSPSPRVGHAMAFDASRGRVVLFGGASNVGRLGDTWEWNGSTWSQLAPAVSPSARLDHAMTFDPVRRRTLLFAGGRANDTWEWDGTTWLQRTPATSPPARYGHVMTWDSSRARAIASAAGTMPSSVSATRGNGTASTGRRRRRRLRRWPPCSRPQPTIRSAARTSFSAATGRRPRTASCGST